MRETEDIEAKVTGLYSKISNPVLANLKLNVDGDVKMNEIYPPQLPDLFHGTQLVVLGRYNGNGKAKIHADRHRRHGKARSSPTRPTSPSRPPEEKPFVEDLWARRKVGYLLDQIRANGEKKELVDEVVTLAKRYGITTPYTSYLVVPDVPVAGLPPTQFFAPVPAPTLPTPTPNPFPGTSNRTPPPASTPHFGSGTGMVPGMMPGGSSGTTNGMAGINGGSMNSPSSGTSSCDGRHEWRFGLYRRTQRSKSG